ncbi:Fur-regulated basic protein FbpA [Bacillus sp. M6-12]|uniref:Fur-regulated basic protein FbpA n=1 Tax=Bacillus sp. M6-12 TaxID=2054166 RepID=UPI0027E4AC2C|nr:Fur-regulated basic protein FbpA [Bacillus sp. M6-12]
MANYLISLVKTQRFICCTNYHLRNVLEQKKDDLKQNLLNMNYFKTPDGKQLYELSLSE